MPCKKDKYPEVLVHLLGAWIFEIFRHDFKAREKHLVLD